MPEDTDLGCCDNLYANTLCPLRPEVSGKESKRRKKGKKQGRRESVFVFDFVFNEGAIRKGALVHQAIVPRMDLEEWLFIGIVSTIPWMRVRKGLEKKGHPVSGRRWKDGGGCPISPSWGTACCIPSRL